MTSPHASLQPLLEELAETTTKLVEKLLSAAAAEQSTHTSVFASLVASLAQDPQTWAESQASHYREHLELWEQAVARAGSSDAVASAAPLAVPEKGDRRFESAEWQLPYFDYLKQAYLLNSRWLNQTVEKAQLDARAKHKLRFYMRQLIDAASPANFLATNPDALKLACSTRGESLIRGLEILKEDLRKDRITTTNDSAFEVGRNLATTPGAVVYENSLFQLIQYAPATSTVRERPLVIIPPCINKYYILDLQPENSFVRYVVAQGHTVFMVSWRNVGPDMDRTTWDDYLENGVIRALEVARDICGVRQVNALGFCVGGTLLASTLAVLRAKRRELAASVTFLTTMLDFGDVGDIDVFIDEDYVRQREADYAQGGIVRGKTLMATFSVLRANDLIWNYVVNNYLKGERPAAFDLLYWNSDSTNLPGPMFAYYVRNTYLENNLRVPRKLTMCGVKVDLGRIKLPTFVLASREDHIVPWKTAYQTTQLVGGPCEFVLAASGHIAGVINPPAQKRRHFWIGHELPEDPDTWLASAEQRAGSWWNHWNDWLVGHGGNNVPARKNLGNTAHRPIESAPGHYVRAPGAQ